MPAAPLTAQRSDMHTAHVAIVSVSHRICEIRRLGAITRNHAEQAELMQQFLRDGAGRARISECAIVTTCNRIEIIFVHDGGAPARTTAAHLIQTMANFGRSAADGDVPFEVFEGREAAAHLMAVACALESLVVGERQILGQLRDALARARGAAAIGPRIESLACEAFRVARRVRRETSLCRGASVVSLATERLRRARSDLMESLARAVAEPFATPGHCYFPIALVGAGDMTTQAATALTKGAHVPLLFVNRTLARAEALAAQFGGRAMALDRFMSEPPAVACVMTATSAPAAILRAPELSALVAARAGALKQAGHIHARPLLVVDLAVPGDVEYSEAVNSLGVECVTIDGLRALAAERACAQRQEITAARDILESRLRRLAGRDARRAEGLALGGARTRGEAAAAAAVARLATLAPATPAATLEKAQIALSMFAHRTAHASVATPPVASATAQAGYLEARNRLRALLRNTPATTPLMFWAWESLAAIGAATGIVLSGAGTGASRREPLFRETVL